MKLDDKVIVLNESGELVAVKVLGENPEEGFTLVQEPDGLRYYIRNDRMVKFTNTYTLQILEDMHKMLGSTQNQ